MRRTLCVVLAGLAVLGACGGDDDDSSEDSSDEASSSDDADRQAYVDAAVDAIGADLDESQMSEDVVTCIAGATVDAVGLDTFRDAEVTPEDFAASESVGDLDLDLPESAAADMTTDLEDCNLAGAFATLLVSSFTGITGETPEGAEQCLAENLDDAELAAVSAQETLLPSEEGEGTSLNTLLATALGSCPDALAELLASSFEAGLGAELETESRDCLVTFVQANAEAVAEGFMSGGATEDGTDILGTDLMNACPTLKAQVEGATGGGG